MTVREFNCRVFFDTETWCRSTEKLRRAIRRSVDGTRLYLPEEEIFLPEEKSLPGMRVEVTPERSFQCAFRLHAQHPDLRIGVLNFASAKNPGGGVRSGASAQEEALCRCSTLYPVLNQPELKKKYYGFHIDRHDPRYTDACIYTPDIVVCKSDTAEPERLPEEKWIRVDVISCAAPNLRPNSVSAQSQPLDIDKEELLELHKSRANRILSAAAANNVDIFVTGAFGCGAFMNDPKIVAKAWRDTLSCFKGRFSEVVFAVFTSRRDTANYEVFRRILGGGLFE